MAEPLKPLAAASLRLLLRAEGAAVAVLCLYFYADTGAGWWLFAALILLPDLAMIGYAAGPRVGALSYNAAHTYLAPIAVWLALSAFNPPLAAPVALIWAVHIGADRLLGYGLKYPDAFRHTHLSG